MDFLWARLDQFPVRPWKEVVLLPVTDVAEGMEGLVELELRWVEVGSCHAPFWIIKRSSECGGKDFMLTSAKGCSYT
ncbi:hypothetical protein EP01_07480 [Bdellovibrio bacteriovorus]|nr:hypothetical protein EP01_07480 [Bdellovibrio bacteriovorus]